MKAEQYRALVSKLEAISEGPFDNAPQHNEPPLKIGDIDPRNGKKILNALVDGSGNVVRSRFGDIWNVKYGPADAPAPAPVANEPEVKPDEPPAPAPEPEVKPDEPPAPVAPEEKCGPEVKEKIKQQKTFNAAYAMAKAAECPEFDWCQIVKVPRQGPSPTPVNKQDYTVAWDPDHQKKLDAGATDLTIPAMSNFTAEDIELEESAFVPGDIELDRIREIAGTQIVEGGWIPGTEKWNPQRIGDIDPKTGKPALNKPEQGGTTTPTKGIPEIKASSKEAAIEIARKKGIKVFKFCGKYKVKDAKKRQGPSPTPVKPEKKPSIGPRFYGQPHNAGNPQLQRAIDQGYIDSTSAGGAAGE